MGDTIVKKTSTTKLSKSQLEALYKLLGAKRAASK
jgi:hypothetical protein